MRTIKEVITDTSFFSIMKENYAGLYTELFEDIDPDLLDVDLLANCSEKFAAPLLLYTTLDKVVKVIVTKYSESWKRIKTALLLDYNILSPYDNKKITTQERQGTTANNSTTTDKTGVATFDSVAMVDKQEDSTENKGTTEQNETVKITVENSGNTGSLSAQNLITAEMELRRRNFIDVVISDITSQITLAIY